MPKTLCETGARREYGVLMREILQWCPWRVGAHLGHAMGAAGATSARTWKSTTAEAWIPRKSYSSSVVCIFCPKHNEWCLKWCVKKSAYCHYSHRYPFHNQTRYSLKFPQQHIAKWLMIPKPWNIKRNRKKKSCLSYREGGDLRLQI